MDSTSTKDTPLLGDHPITSDSTSSYSLATDDIHPPTKPFRQLSRQYRVLITATLIVFTIAFCASLGIFLIVARSSSPPPPIPAPTPPPPTPINVTCSPSLSPASCLRLYLAAYNLTAYIVPSNDAHNSESVADADKRREFISNFTGSAGTALIINLPNVLNRLFTDSRYEIQVAQELNPAEWTWTAAGVNQLQTWVIANLKNSTIGIDPSLISASAFTSQAATYAAAGITFVPVLQNLVDLVWGAARPAASQEPLFALALNVTGETVAQKMTRVRRLMTNQRCAALVVSALDDIAWVTNLRGRDVDDTPVFLSYLVITFTDIQLYVDLNKTINVQGYAKDNGITFRPYEALVPDLKILNQTLSTTARVWLSSPTQNILGSFSTAFVYSATSPLIYMKAVKNAVELAAMKHAHKKDSAAFVIFFDWLERHLAAGNSIDECEAATQIELIRSQMPNFVELSYPTIAGSGPNGAIVHYFPKPPTCAQVTTKLMFLVDSGGQWSDCSTTDTTRTIHMGNATFFERHAFTRVLQGHIDLMNVVWVDGQTPSDWPARQPLLRDGLTYSHGTSHGVGLMLNVHESVGGAYISGVITSVEPGYYHIAKNDSRMEAIWPGWGQGFGVRIETDAVVVEHPTPQNVTKYWTYEPLAWVPLQTSLIRSSLMSDQQIAWVNWYNAKCVEALRPYLVGWPASAMKWLERNAIPLVKNMYD